MMASLRVLLRSVSMSQPKTVMPLMTSSRIWMEFSPIPAVKTIASTPFMTAMYWPMYFWIRLTKISWANWARSLPSLAADKMSRISLDTPEIPKRPDFLLRMLTISATSLMPSFCITKATKEASISPVRVPMVKPANGVKPIEVSTEIPPSTAVIEAPLPKWQVMILRSLTSLPIISAARRAT